jgi:asparagine synthase (glutamine-hydrolysing)
MDVPRWRRRFGPMARVPGFGFLARKFTAAIAPAFLKAIPKALGVLEYSGSWAGTYLVRRGLFLPHELFELMDRDVAREGLRRLEPVRRLEANLKPDPISDNSRVCALESGHYMRNQLLRDADWVGMAHSLEIRVPLVDVTLIRSLAPVIPTLTAGGGKTALAMAPTRMLPNDVVARAKTGFNVPTDEWISSAADGGSEPLGRARLAKGLISRRWSHAVLEGMMSTKAQREVDAA